MANTWIAPPVNAKRWGGVEPSAGTRQIPADGDPSVSEEAG